MSEQHAQAADEQAHGEGGAGRRALVVGAHPDDIEFGIAGTVARWVEEGWDVRYVIVTSGQRGVQDIDTDPEAFGRVRESEARDAAAAVGVTDVTFLRYMDTEVVHNRNLERDLSREFRRARPHRLAVMDPEQLIGDGFVNHPDHRAVGAASLDITVTGGTTAAIFPELLRAEGLEPWRGLEEIWLMGPAGGDHVVDITTTFDRKIASLQAHKSQMAQLSFDVRAFLGARLAELGKPHGYAYAEAFRVLSRGR
jgi:LmbE family N-acetylglucosaminyl deacetylase